MKTRNLIIATVCIGILGSLEYYYLRKLANESKGSSQGFDISIGNDSAKTITTASYVFCYGDDACPGITTQDCTVDVKPLTSNIKVGAKIDQAVVDIGSITRALAVQDKMCGKGHSERIYEGLVKTGAIREIR